MALLQLDIAKNWFTGSTVREINWDNLRDPLLTWSESLQNDINQMRIDVLGSTYSFDNDGLANLASPIYNILTSGSALPWTFTGQILFNGNDVKIYNGSDLITYSDAGITPTITLDGATGDGTITGNLDVTGTLDVTGLFTTGDYTASGLLTIDQDAEAVALLIDSEGTTSNAITVTAPTQTTGHIMQVDADALTTGSMLMLVSDSADTGVRNLVQISNDNTAAINSIPLVVNQDAAERALLIDQNANAIALSIDSESTTASVLDIVSPATTTGNVIDIDANALTTGRAINIASDSSDANTRYLIQILNENISATGAVPLRIQQDAAGTALQITQNADAYAVSVTGTGLTTDNTVNIVSDNLTTGRALHVYSNSSDAGTRNLVDIRNDNTAATGATGLRVQQDAAVRAMLIDQNANSNAIVIDSEATTVGGILRIDTNTLTSGVAIQMNDADALTSGSLLSITSNSSDATGRNLVSIHNDNTSATGAHCLRLKNDAIGETLNIADAAGTVASFLEDGALLLPDLDPPEANEANRHGIMKGLFKARWDGATWILDFSYNVSSITSTSSTRFNINWDTDSAAGEYQVVANYRNSGITVGTDYLGGSTAGASHIVLSSPSGGGSHVSGYAMGDQ